MATPLLTPRPGTNPFAGMPSTVTPTGPTGIGPSSTAFQTGGAPTNAPTTGSPRASGQAFVNNTTNAYNNQQGPLANQGAQNYANASTTNMSNYNSLMGGYNQMYQNAGGGGGGPTSSTGGGGSTAGLNTRLPGETSYQWTQRVANATGRSDIANDPAALQYWADSINSKPQSGDMGYWIDKFTGGGGGGGGSSGGFGGSFSSVSPMFATAMFAPPAQQAATQQAATERAAIERASASPMLNPLERVTASNPFNSYGGYQDFSNTGGFSAADMENMRARGISPIRAAYANAERNIGQQRSLQGGYSPNAIAAQVKMAREQGQGMADASQNVEAQLATMRQQGRLAGLGGMSNIEQQRLGAQMQGDIFNANQAFQGQQFDIGNINDINKFNVTQGNQGNQFNAAQGNQVGMFNAGQGNTVGMFNAGQANDIGMFNAGQGNQVGMFNAGQGNQVGMFNANQGQNAYQFGVNTQMGALNNASNLYGTTPGMAATFGNQALGFLNSRGSQGDAAMGAFNQANTQPDAYAQDLARINATGNTIAAGAQAFGTGLNAYQNRPGQQPQTPYQWQGPTQPSQPAYNFPQPTPYTGGQSYPGYNSPSIFSAPPPATTDVYRYPNYYA